MKRPFSLWLLIFLLVFLAVGGLYGGISMLLDPSGKILQMDKVLPLLPVPNYFIPGLFLIFMMGLIPIFLTYGLIWKPNWDWANKLAGWSRHYWAWSGSFLLGCVLIFWLVFQAVLIGFRWPIQYVTLANGILIVLVALMPGVRKYFK
jgi:hypothetical protein